VFSYSSGSLMDAPDMDLLEASHQPPYEPLQIPGPTNSKATIDGSNDALNPNS